MNRGMGSLKEIAHDSRRDGARVFSIVQDGACYWVKFARKDYKNALQRYLLQTKDQSLLQGEMRAMEALRARGMRVPQVVYHEADYLIMTDLGESLQQLLRRLPLQQQLLWVEQLASMLRTLHAQGGWHGNAMVRNITVEQGKFGFIDLENTAHRWWPLALRQAYDVWQVLFSLAREPQGSQLMGCFLKHYVASRPVAGWLRGAACCLAPFYVLFLPFRAVLKRDILQILITVQALWLV